MSDASESFSVLQVNCPDLPLPELQTGRQMIARQAIDGTAVAAAVRAHDYRIIIMRLPLSDMRIGDVMSDLRRHPDSKSRAAAVVVIAEPGQAVLKDEQERRGISEILSAPVNPARLAEVMLRFADYAIRREVRLMLKLRLELKPGDKPFFGQAHNLSQTGMLLASEKELEIGTPLEIILTLPGDSSPIKLSGGVVREAPERRRLGRAYGVRFIYVEESALKRIANYCDAD